MEFHSQHVFRHATGLRIAIIQLALPMQKAAKTDPMRRRIGMTLANRFPHSAELMSRSITVLQYYR
jgi:hypothetical protein